jgi:acyl carrier protein
MNTVNNDLHQLIANALRIPAASVNADTAMETTPAWDSLAHMDLIVTIEERYAIQLSPDDMVAMRSVGAISSLLQGKGVLQ